MTDISGLLEEGKQRHAALKRFAKRPKRLYWLISAALTAYTLFKGTGALSIPLIGLGALTIFLLYYAIPLSGNALLSGVRLFIRRASALLIDGIVIALVIVPLMVWYRADFQRTEDVLQVSAGRILMLALWSTVMYFVICDWHYGATIGKRLVALRVTDLDGRRVSFCASFVRNLLSLSLPVLFGVLLAFRIDSLPRTASRLVVGDMTKQAFVALIPMSILLFGGNQSVIDRLTHTVIRAEHESPHVFSETSAKVWILLGISVIAWAGVHSSLLYLSLLKNTADNPTKGLPAGTQVYWNASEPDTTRILWLVLPVGLKNPTYAIRGIEIEEEASVNPIKLDIDDTHFFVALNPKLYLTDQTKLQVVRVTLARDDPSLIKVLLLQNYEAFINQNIPVTQRPFFSELELVTENEYGLFSTGKQENYLLCAMVSKNHPVAFYSPMLPHGAVSLHWSLDHLGAVLAGLGIPNSSQPY
jgi:uncharacterized RDD family membrane protein YckC